LTTKTLIWIRQLSQPVSNVLRVENTEVDKNWWSTNQ